MGKIEKAQEYYETFERLKYNEDFIEFKKVVDRELERLDSLIHDPADKEEMWVNSLVYKKLKILFDIWFDNAENEAKQIRTKIAKRKNRKDT